MKTKTIALIAVLSAGLMGCADTSHYPVTGAPVSAGDQVQFMTSPNVAHF